MLTVSQFDLLHFKQLLILKNVEIHVCGGFSSPGVGAGSGNPKLRETRPISNQIKAKISK